MQRIYLAIETLKPGGLEEIHELAEACGFDTTISTLFKIEFEDFFRNGINYIIFSEDKKVSFLIKITDIESSFEEAREFIKSVGKITA